MMNVSTNFYKKIFLNSFYVFFLFLFCQVNNSMAQSIEVVNTSSLRKSSIIEVPWPELKSKYPKLSQENISVFDGKNELPIQFEYLGNSEPKNLLVRVDGLKKGKTLLKVKSKKSTKTEAKTFGRYVPERLDDFAWENDKIAYRTYGKALEGTKGMAYGIDVWVKRTDKLVIDKRYKIADYHHDLGDGLDYYHVGLTLGAGGIAPIFKDSIHYSQNYKRWKVLDQGACRVNFILEYDPWIVNGKSVSMNKMFTLDAGSQLNKVAVDAKFETDSLNVVVGIIKRPEPGFISLNEKSGIGLYWEPKHGDDGTTGVGFILPKSAIGSSITKDQMLMTSTIKKNVPYVYYAGAAWDKAGEITNENQWISYIENFKKNIDTPLQINIK
jgi:hypothetical protein